MELRPLLERIGETYDRELGQAGEAQQLLRGAPATLEALVPAGYVPDASGGKGNAATVPWIAVFNPDETLTARRGMYVVYLFDAEMRTVALSLNQGVTEIVEKEGTRRGRELLINQADAIRNELPAKLASGMNATIDLRSRKDLPRHYEAGNIVSVAYDLRTLPEQSVLEDDLGRMVRLYGLALEIRDGLRLSRHDAIVTTSPAAPRSDNVEFKPKNESEYVQVVKARTVRKRRDHERVVRLYGSYLREQGLTPNTNVHPRDLTADGPSGHWLIEVKVVYRGNGVQATRDALSQLLMYRDVFYAKHAQVNMLAVFSEPVGKFCTDFLERYDIAAVWKAGGGWAGSLRARSAQLALP